MRLANIIAYILVVVGGLNWGLYGIFNFNLVAYVFGGARAVGAIIVYCIIAVAAIWLILSPFMTGGVLWLTNHRSGR